MAEQTLDTDGTEDIDDESETLYLKYEFDGFSTIVGLADALRDLADELDDRETAGWRLAGPVESGWVHLEPPA